MNKFFGFTCYWDIFDNKIEKAEGCGKKGSLDGHGLRGPLTRVRFLRLVMIRSTAQLLMSPDAGGLVPSKTRCLASDAQMVKARAVIDVRYCAWQDARRARVVGEVVLLT